ncbi:MAG: hypothetical protein EXR11_10340 [Rhodospirillaceae bacterium]|nr:hypothetical protein [Rhodospirillaceae bacterium]
MADEKRAGDRPKAASDFIKSDSDNAVFLGNPHIDNLMTIVIAMGAEIWADRQRMRIIEHLLETKGKVTKDMVEQFVPSDEQKAAWGAERDAMAKRVYSVMARDTSTAKPFGEEFKYK